MAEKKWQLLAKRIVTGGQPRTYTLAELQQEFLNFVDYYVNNPVMMTMRTKQRKKGNGKSNGAEEVEVSGDRVERVAPMTEMAFCLWMGKSKSWFPQTITDLRDKEYRTQEDEDILQFMLKVQTFLNSQLLDGAILGDYTPNLVANILGIRNNFDVTSNGKAAAVPVINIVEDNKTREDYDTSKKG